MAKNDDKFSKLDEEWRSQMLSSPNENVNSTIVTSAVNLISLELAKKLDDDLLSLKEQLKVANEQYSEGKKVNLLRMEFLIEVLRSRGLNVPDVSDFVKKAKNEAISEV